MSLLAQTIGQIFEIEFCQILPFWASFILKSGQNYLQFKFHDLILYWAYDRYLYIRIPHSKCVQGGEVEFGTKRDLLHVSVSEKMNKTAYCCQIPEKKIISILFAFLLSFLPLSLNEWFRSKYALFAQKVESH